MFAYQRNIWNPETVKALFSKIPDNRILILDYANDYNNNWQPMNAFNCINRYGTYPDVLAKSWKLLRESCYRNLIPHPQLGWQLVHCQDGSITNDPKFEQATLLFLSCSNKLGEMPCYQEDALERAAITLSIKADQWFVIASNAYSARNIEVGDRTGKRGLELFTELDRLLESHPLNRTDRRLSLARSHSINSELQHFYESNTRQIITVWGPPVNDYSCRIWSGLVRDFYRERMAKILESIKTGKPFNKNQWEHAWVANSGISPIKPFDNPLQAARELVTKALSEELPKLNNFNKNIIGN